MKAHYTTQNGQIRFEMEGETPKALFAQISSIQEVFDSQTQCGMCQSNNLRYLARKVDDFDFYELACVDCHARFSFGQSKKGGALFPKRKSEDGSWLPNDGWSKYQAPQQIQQTAAPARGNGRSAPRNSQPPAGSDWQPSDSDVPF